MDTRMDQFLLDYVLHNVCGGNVNELARRIDMNPSDLRRRMKDMRSGHSSLTVMTAVMSLILQDKTIDLNELRRRYLEQSFVKDDVCPYSKVIERITSRYREIAALKEMTDSQYMLYHLAEGFLIQLTKNHCSAYCVHQYEDDTCPCKRFGDLMEFCAPASFGDNSMVGIQFSAQGR